MIVTGHRIALSTGRAEAALLSDAIDAALIAIFKPTGELAITALIGVAETALFAELFAGGRLFADPLSVADIVPITELTGETETAEVTDAVFTALLPLLSRGALTGGRATLTELALRGVSALARVKTRAAVLSLSTYARGRAATALTGEPYPTLDITETGAAELSLTVNAEPCRWIIFTTTTI